MVLFQAFFLTLGAGFLIGIKKPAERAAALIQGAEVTEEAPKELADLQHAGDEQLTYWADHLSKFDGREFGYITPARSQGTRNTCWAYAAVGAVEASILREGINQNATKYNLDFDETIAAYTRHTRDGEQDPLLLTTNDTYDFGRWNQGDNAVNAFAIMTQGYTLLRENSFHPSVDVSKIKSCLQQSEYYVQSYQSIPYDKNAIKRAVLQYGAVTFNYSAPSRKKYYDPYAASNHTSIIVGWDDSVKSSEFSPRQPQGDGAWIIKNSWGNDQFNGGYGEINGTWCYYISYELPIGGLYSVDLAMKEDYQNLYYYDGNITGTLQKYYAESQAAIYEAKLSSPTKQEQLKAVMISVPQEDLNVNIKIYKNLKVNPGNVNDPINQPNQGVPVAEMDTHLERSGMHTIDLKTPVALEQGEYFSVVVSCKSRYGTSVAVNCAVDNSASVNDMTYYFYNGKWTSYKNSNSYADASFVNQSCRIRAITNTVDRERNLGKNLKYARVEIANRLVYYKKGEQSVPELQVYLGDNLLIKDKDYRVEVQEIVSPGMATVKMTGMGEYQGVRTTYFEVAKPQNPPDEMGGTVDVYNNVTDLHDIALPVDWEWVDENRKLDVGMSNLVSIKYVGADKDFYQNLTRDFYINKIAQDPPADIDISHAEVEIEGVYAYTGAQIEPRMRVICQNKVLHRDIDFTLTFQNNVRAGTATVTIQGFGRYFDQISLDFEIHKADHPAQMPPSSMTVGRKTKSLQSVALTDGWQWEAPNTEIDRESIQAWAVYSDTVNYENYRTEITLTKELPKDIAGLQIELGVLSFVYNGTEQTPNIVATDGEWTLVSGVDFDVEYQNNKNAGQASVTVKGKNDYRGSKTFTFTIERAERQNFRVVFAGWTYGDATTPDPHAEGEMEISAVTYTYSDAENGVYTDSKPTSAGVYWIKAEIESSQNYRSAVAKAEFTIAKAASPAQMPPSSMTVGRKTKSLQSVALTDGWQWETPNTEIDRESMQAWAVYSDTVNYENYRTEITLTKEPPKDVAGLQVQLEVLSFVYNGTEQTPNIIASDGELSLIAGIDFDVEYQNNKNAGSGKAVVTFKNDYSGTKELVFTIEQAEKPTADTTIRCSEKATTLSDISLPDGFVWEDGSVKISENRLTAKAIYRGDDAGNYKTTELYFDIIIEEQAQPDRQTDLTWLAIAIPVSVLTVAGLGFALARRKRKKT